MSSPWQVTLKDPRSRWKHMFETKVLSDCSFIVGKRNGQLVAGHKVIISAASPVLHDKLKAAVGDQPKVILTDIEPDIFQSMLSYIYLDSVDINTKNVFDLAAAAKDYQIPELLKKCLDFMAATNNLLTAKNVLEAYSYVFHSSENAELKTKCEEVLKANAKAVLSDSSFVDACLDVVVAMFSLESLDIDSELELLNAADRYAKHISTCNNATSGNLTVRNILEQIRFLSLTPEELDKGRATTTVLPASDACAILAHLTYDKTGVQMPPGFSLRRDPRKKKNVTQIVASEIKFKYRVLDIENLIKKREVAWSSVFMLHNLKWKVGVQTWLTKDSKKFLTIFVRNYWENKSDKWLCKAKFEISLLRADNGPVTIRLGDTKEFKNNVFSWGFLHFVETSKVLDTENHYIKDGAITFEVYIKADEPEGL